MQKSIRSKIATDNFLLLLIVIVAAILRLWNFANIPYMHDELSALARTNYSNFHDEVYYGVAKLDTHPAGVQLFLYYWTKLFGENEMVVKFPFIICGLLSIIVAYRIAKQWFNSSVGLVVASFMAAMQYMITYSQIARPYISGLLFCLLMVWCWSNYFFNTTDKKNKWLIGYVLSAALCAYDHHFALLFAIIVGITGIFFLNKTNWKAYVIAGVSIFILYIPHLKIFFMQLAKGGLGGSDGWLGKPGEGWLLTYLKYTLHYSYAMYVLALGVMLCGFFVFSKEWIPTQKYRAVSIVWFLAVFFIEYFYSVYVNPIIQFSTIIFVFPFLLMFIFSLLGELTQNAKTIIVFSILIIGTTTLVFQRKHYSIFYHQPYQEQVINTYKVIDEIGGDKKATIELLIPPYFKEHYFKKYNRGFDCIYYNVFDEKINLKAFREFVNKQTTDYFIFGCPPLDYIQIIKEKYPYLIKKEEGFLYSFYCFAKQKPVKEIKEQVVYEKNIDLNSIGNKMDSSIEYGRAFKERIKHLTNGKHCILTITAKLKTDTLSNPTLVADIQDDDRSLFWNGADYLSYGNQLSGTIYLSKQMTDFDISNYPKAEIKIYIWNRSKKNVSIESMNIEVVKSNPFIYSLYEPLD